jgi:oligopeptide/dipeptide ABC transporter ATP-binding protein
MSDQVALDPLDAEPAAERQFRSPRQVLLDVRDLTVAFRVGEQRLRAVDGLTFDVARGERVGIVGESGSGKSQTALSLIGLTEAEVSGQVFFRGVDLLRLPTSVLRRMRGSDIGFVFQDPLASLNPVLTVGQQVMEPLLVRGVKRATARDRAVTMLERVGIRDARRRIDDYPHQFSGGMRQRVVIAGALIGEPELLIADEPTTALDVRVQAQVLDLLDELADERGMAVLLITHDIGIVAGFTDRVMVMYAGISVETALTTDLFYAGEHPYTWGLLGSIPRPDARSRDELPVIRGRPPTLGGRPSGCRFHPRCDFVEPRCRVDVPTLLSADGDRHLCACHFAGQLPRPRHIGRQPPNE